MGCSVLYTVCYLLIEGFELSGVHALEEVTICSAGSHLTMQVLCAGAVGLICDDLDIIVRR